MSDKKGLIESLKKPSGWFLALVYGLTALFIGGALALVILSPKGLFWEIVSYTFYGLAAITLGYTVYTLVLYAPSLKTRLIARMKRNKLINSLLENYGYRTVVFAAVSLFINIAFAAFHLAIAIKYLDGWYLTLAIYYLVLISLRSGIVLYHRKRAVETKKGALVKEEKVRKKTELKKYRFCGILLVALPWTLSFEILQMIQGGLGFSYFGLTIYVVAVYTFLRITTSIIHFVRARKEDDMTVQALRNVNLADSFVSVLALQTAMFASFGNGMNTSLFNALTGAGVCILTAALGIYMIVKGQKKLKKLKEEDYGEE